MGLGPLFLQDGDVRIALTAVLLAASTVLTAFTVLNLGVYSDDDRPAMAWATYTLWALFALSVWALRGVRGRAVTALVLIGCAVLGASAMAGPPNTSTDSARYAWDGIVQNAGISPYEYVPADAALAELRTDWLFPAPTVAADGSESCDGERISKTREVGTDDVLCTAINRPQVPTIYPPLAEMLFAGVRFFVGPSAEYWPLQAVGLLFVLGTAALLLRALRRRNLPGWQAALWAWCPLVLAEGVTNSHVDLVGAVLILVATLSVTIGRRALGGVALGGAIAVKLIPVIAAPALLRRQGWKVIAAAIATFAVLYIPYILSTGIGVLGYLPGYLSEEGYEDGSRFGLISLFAPGSAALPVAAILLVVTAVAVIVATDPERPWVAQLVMIGVTLLIVSPRYPWYALLLVPFIAMSGRWEWFVIGLSILNRQIFPSLAVQRWGIAVSIVVLVAVSWWRHGPDAPQQLWRGIRRRLPGRGRDAVTGSSVAAGTPDVADRPDVA